LKKFLRKRDEMKWEFLPNIRESDPTFWVHRKVVVKEVELEGKMVYIDWTTLPFVVRVYHLNTGKPLAMTLFRPSSGTSSGLLEPESSRRGRVVRVGINANNIDVWALLVTRLDWKLWSDRKSGHIEDWIPVTCSQLRDGLSWWGICSGVEKSGQWIDSNTDGGEGGGVGFVSNTTYSR